uniref:hypothetical protein n=1 Tax=Nonomuraea sp. CA-251285 TaxID=3240002 RepID=UPI003F494931
MLPPPAPIDQTWRLVRACTVSAASRDYADLVSDLQPQHRYPDGIGLVFFESPLHGSTYVDTLINGKRHARDIATGVVFDLQHATGAVYTGWIYTPAWDLYRPGGPWWRDTGQGIVYATSEVVTYEGGHRWPATPGDASVQWHCLRCHDSHHGWQSNSPSNRRDMTASGIMHVQRCQARPPKQLAAQLAAAIAARQKDRAIHVTTAAREHNCLECAYLAELTNTALVAKNTAA